MALLRSDATKQIFHALDYNLKFWQRGDKRKGVTKKMNTSKFSYIHLELNSTRSAQYAEQEGTWARVSTQVQWKDKPMASLKRHAAGWFLQASTCVLRISQGWQAICWLTHTTHLSQFVYCMKQYKMEILLSAGRSRKLHQWYFDQDLSQSFRYSFWKVNTHFSIHSPGSCL